MKRFCKVFLCEWQREKICCADCQDRNDCVNVCLNWPNRCRLEDREKRIDRRQEKI